MKYKVFMEVEIEARNKAELEYILLETYDCNEMDKVRIINEKGIELGGKHGKVQE